MRENRKAFTCDAQVEPELERAKQAKTGNFQAASALFRENRKEAGNSGSVLRPAAGAQAVLVSVAARAVCCDREAQNSDCVGVRRD